MGHGRPGKKGASRIGKELWQKYEEPVNFLSEARGTDDREKLHALPTQASAGDLD